MKKIKSTGEKIKELREIKGLTQKEFADLIDISESFISYVEKGAKFMHPKNLRRITEVFRLDPSYFSDKNLTPVNFRGGTEEGGSSVDYTKIVEDFRKYARKIK